MAARIYILDDFVADEGSLSFDQTSLAVTISKGKITCIDNKYSNIIEQIPFVTLDDASTTVNNLVLSGVNLKPVGNKLVKNGVSLFLDQNDKARVVRVTYDGDNHVAGAYDKHTSIYYENGDYKLSSLNLKGFKLIGHNAVVIIDKLDHDI